MQIPQLTFTRFIAALAIVILHFGLFNWPFETEPINQLAYKFTVSVGYFFLLSGFILVIASEKNDPEKKNTMLNLKTFWIKRAARILPLYLLSLTIYFFFHFDYNPDIPLKWQIQSYIYSLFFLQTWNYPMATDVNFPAWSLSVEAFLYFLFPWLYYLLSRFQTKVLISISLLSCVASTLLFKILIDAGLPHNLTHYFPPFHVATFLMGVIGGILFLRHYTYLTQHSQALWVLLTLSTVFIIYTACSNWQFYKYSENGLLAPYFLLIIYTLSVSRGKLVDVLSSKPFVFMGDISYAIYLFQLPVLEFSSKYLPFFQGKETHEIFYYYLILLILVAMIMHLCIEQPLRKRINKLANA